MTRFDSFLIIFRELLNAFPIFLYDNKLLKSVTAGPGRVGRGRAAECEKFPLVDDELARPSATLVNPGTQICKVWCRCYRFVDIPGFMVEGGGRFRPAPLPTGLGLTSFAWGPGSC